MRTSGFAALKRSRARPHPKPAGPQSAAERREECRHGGMNPADLHAEGNARGARRASASERAPPAAASAARKGRPCQGRAPPRQRRGRGRQRGGHPRAAPTRREVEDLAARSAAAKGC